ncbi:glycosyltransferase [Candidatus Fermentibacteria bacterium]|nr:glycosyltransferase [Candidatus Fermentibacteria bacterium]
MRPRPRNVESCTIASIGGSATRSSAVRPEHLHFRNEARSMIEAFLATPIPPCRTGLATYALRVIRATAEHVSWTVGYTEGSDPSRLPEGVRAVPLGAVTNGSDLPERRFFQLGNSPHCFEVLRKLYGLGGASVFHETVLHHMLRHCLLQKNQVEEYRREVRFAYGPAAEKVLETLDRADLPPEEYDRLLKSYPLIARAVNSSDLVVCLNEYARHTLLGLAGSTRVVRIAHPLSPVEEVVSPENVPEGFLLGMVGRYHHGRNLGMVLRAVGQLRRKMDASLALIGSGYPENLPSWVVRTGEVDEPRYQGWIRSLDVGIDVRFPTCGETSGSLLEVMRAGVPVVVSATGSFLEIPSSAVVRLPVETMAGALPGALEALYADRDRRERMALEGKRYAEDVGSMERAESEWRSLMEWKPSEPPEPFHQPSLAAAWHDPPPGFERETKGSSVRWSFSGRASIPGPDWASRVWVTARGPGSVNGTLLEETDSIIELQGADLLFKGRGSLTAVHWR